MTTLRITAGTLRGRKIPVPRGEVRPTSERARQAYFNIVGDRINGARFLDLFAGSGIFSFEAVSRGAVSSLAIDEWRESNLGIEKIAKSLEVPVEVMTAEVLEGLKRLGKREFDLVYADPPYAYAHYDPLLSALDAAPLADGALIAVEHRRRTSPFTIEPRRLRFSRRAEYGEVWITFYETGEP